MKITITTAIDLENKEVASIAEKVADAQKIEVETVDVDHVVDPTVIGGLKIRIGSKTVDATLQRQLQDIKSRASKS